MSIDPREIDNEELKRELDSALGNLAPEDFDTGDMPEVAEAQPDERGRIRGTIIDVRGPDVVVHLGGKSEAFVPVMEFGEDDPPQVGQSREFIAQGRDKETGAWQLSLHEAKHAAALEALKPGDVIEARVTGLNIGGLELMHNQVRCFMPKSQVELERIEDFTPYIGRKLEGEITEINRKGKSAVMSRRKLLERQRDAAREEMRSHLAVGESRTGTVRRLADFGAFVDIGGGVEGLLHISDMTYGRVGHPKEVVKVGDQVQVQVLKVDHERGRISLGMKQLKSDPWGLAAANYRPGSVVEGKVVKLMDFGAFVELEEGIEGLIPISEMSWGKRVHHPRDVVNAGERVRVSILSVDADKRKMSLSLKALGEDPWRTVAERYTADSVVKGRVSKLAEFGAFIELEEGVEGLVHISELSDKHVRRVADVVNEGDVVEVRVKAVDIEQRRISLSMKPKDAPGAQAHAETAAGGIEAASHASKKRKKPLKGGLDRGW